MAPAALPLAVVNGLLGVLRGAPALAWFRRSSPTPQSTSTRWVDFAPAGLFIAAFVLGRFVTAPDWSGDVLVLFSRILGVYDAFLVAAVLPNRFPGTTAWKRGLQALPVRFIGPLAAYAGLSAMGVPLSPLVWVLGLAPVPLNSLVLARAFDLDHEVVSTQLVLTTSWPCWPYPWSTSWSRVHTLACI